MSESLEGMKAMTEYKEGEGSALLLKANGRLYILYCNSSYTNDEFRVHVDFDTDSIATARSS